VAPCRNSESFISTSRTCRTNSGRLDLDKIIYANPIKANETLQELNRTNRCHLRQLRGNPQNQEARPQAGLALRLKVTNTGAMVELSSKFGAAPAKPWT